MSLMRLPALQLALLCGAACCVSSCRMKIYAFGDSVTQGSSASKDQWGSYRYLLWKGLTEAGRDVQFVGSISTQWCSGDPYCCGTMQGTVQCGVANPLVADQTTVAPATPDVARMHPNGTFMGTASFPLWHDGHWGWTSTHVRTYLHGWLDVLALHNEIPDVALLHIGTNDLIGCLNWNNLCLAETTVAIENIKVMITALRARNKRITIILARIINCYTQGCTERAAIYQDYNNKITQLVEDKHTLTSAVVLISPEVLQTETYDLIHPNKAGEAKLASAFEAAINSVCQCPVGPSPVPTWSCCGGASAWTDTVTPQTCTTPPTPLPTWAPITSAPTEGPTAKPTLGPTTAMPTAAPMTVGPTAKPTPMPIWPTITDLTGVALISGVTSGRMTDEFVAQSGIRGTAAVTELTNSIKKPTQYCATMGVVGYGVDEFLALEELGFKQALAILSKTSAERVLSLATVYISPTTHVNFCILTVTTAPTAAPSTVPSAAPSAAPCEGAACTPMAPITLAPTTGAPGNTEAPSSSTIVGAAAAKQGGATADGGLTALVVVLFVLLGAVALVAVVASIAAAVTCRRACHGKKAVVVDDNASLEMPDLDQDTDSLDLEAFAEEEAPPKEEEEEDTVVRRPSSIRMDALLNKLGQGGTEKASMNSNPLYKRKVKSSAGDEKKKKTKKGGVGAVEAPAPAASAASASASAPAPAADKVAGGKQQTVEQESGRRPSTMSIALAEATMRTEAALAAVVASKAADPLVLVGASKSDPDEVAVSGWTKTFDEHLHTHFWVSDQTGETVWVRPRDPKAERAKVRRKSSVRRERRESLGGAEAKPRRQQRRNSTGGGVAPQRQRSRRKSHAEWEAAVIGLDGEGGDGETVGTDGGADGLLEKKKGPQQSSVEASEEMPTLRDGGETDGEVDGLMVDVHAPAGDGKDHQHHNSPKSSPARVGRKKKGRRRSSMQAVPWMLIADADTGDEYYYNAVTHEVAWELAEGVQVSNPGAAITWPPPE